MEEKEILEGALPQATENIETDKVGATIPDTEKDSKTDRTIAVKFNKEIRELSYEEAATLAQKGMKYDSIAEDLSRLKELSGGKSLKEYIASLDNTVATDMGLDELRENFPQIRNEADIPEEVLTAVKKEGGSLLDRYLRYRLSEERQANKAREKQQQNSETSVGSQRSSNGASNEINDEFIRGLWN